MIHFDVAEKRRLHAVVIALRDGIELVVVAARALHREPEHAAPDGPDHVVQIVEPILGIVLFAEADLGVVAQEARRDQAIRA